MKFFYVTSILILTGVSAHSQQISYSTPASLRHGWRMTDIRSSTGATADNYYVVYRDFGGRWALKHHVNTYLKIYSLKGDSVLNTVYLNPLLSPEPKKVLVNQVVLWKNHLVVLFTTHNGVGNGALVGCQLLELNGKKKGRAVILGFLAKRYNTVPESSRPSPVFNRREARIQANGLKWAFNSDSSRMAVYVASKDLTQAAQFVVVDSTLRVRGKINCDFACGLEKINLVAFRRYRQGTMYALISGHLPRDRKNVVYDLVQIDSSGKKVHHIPLALRGADILDALFTLEASGRVVITGSYHDYRGAGGPHTTQGVFTMTVAKGDRKITQQSSYEFASDLVNQLGGKRAASKEKGLPSVIWICKMQPLPGNRIAVIGQSRTRAAQRVGTSTAMNQYFDANGTLLFYEITPSGEIGWAGGVKRHLLNLELAARTAPVFFDGTSGIVQVLYDAAKQSNQYKPAIYLDTYSQSGPATSELMALEGRKQSRRRILWSTARRTEAGHVVAAYYDGPKKQMGTVEISFPRRSDLFTKSGVSAPEGRSEATP